MMQVSEQKTLGQKEFQELFLVDDVGGHPSVTVKQSFL